MKTNSWWNPRSWFGDGSAASEPTGRDVARGVPLGAVKALPGAAVRRMFSFENRRRSQRPLVQSELMLEQTEPVRNDLAEEDVELVVRRKDARLIHETRPPSGGRRYDSELVLNRLRRRASMSDRVVSVE
jgi:hypothetical protein